MFQFQSMFSWRWNIMPHFRDLPVARNWQIRLAESNISGSRVLVGRNNNLFANVINNVGKQGLDGRSEIVLEFKRLSGYGDNECLRTGMKNGLRVSEQSGNVEVMSERVARTWGLALLRHISMSQQFSPSEASMKITSSASLTDSASSGVS